MSWSPVAGLDPVTGFGPLPILGSLTLVQQSTPTWQQAIELLCSRQSPDGVECLHPAGLPRLSLLESLGDPRVAATVEQRQAGRQLHDQLRGLIDQLGVFERMSRCPILGIAGLLNAGKSSLLATYLSPSGRRRVLRGLANNAGTNRFVLWLPTRWRDQPELIETLQSFVSQLFNHAPEPLDDDPELAMRQYNGQLLAQGEERGVDPLRVPLVAFDAGLDALQLGLLDCPDIQSGIGPTGGDELLATVRQRQLAAVGRLCSAFIVVSKMSSLHDQSLAEVFRALGEAMPGVPRLLAVNRVKARYAPETVANEARALVHGHNIQSTHVAYDYRSSWRIPRPPMPRDAARTRRCAAHLLRSRPDRERPAAPGGQRNYLFDLGRRLDIGACESCRSLLVQLHSRGWRPPIGIYNPGLRQQQLEAVWQAIALACHEFMAHRDFMTIRTIRSDFAYRPRRRLSLRCLKVCTDSPVLLRPSLAIDRSVRQLQQAVAAKAGKLSVLRSASRKVTDLANRFRRGDGAQVVTPERIGDCIREFDSQGALQGLPEDELRQGCGAALTRFAAENQPVLDPRALDEWSRAVWKELKWNELLKRGLQPVALISGPLLAATLIPFDGGGTAILVFASTQELLAAAGISAVLTTAAGGGQALRIIEEETPWRQLADLFAILCDQLGVPRPAREQLPKVGSPARRMAPSQTPTGPSAVAPWLTLYQPSPDAITRLQAAAKQLV